MAIFVYKGQVADVLGSGSHKIFTDNVPILTRIANWSFGFESPLRAELHFVNGSLLREEDGEPLSLFYMR